MIEVRRNYLPDCDVQRLAVLFKGAEDWTFGEDTGQVFGPEHQAFGGGRMPTDGERYRTAFDHSDSLHDCAEVKAVATAVKAEHWACYRMRPGHGLRMHRDSYFGGACSYALYLNRRWCWDWGGLLHVVSDDADRCDVVFPEFNAMCVMHHGDHGSAHFVSPVAPWALDPRYVLVAFGGTG